MNLRLLAASVMEKMGFPTTRQSRVSLRHETINQRSGASVATVKSALTAAESGDTRQLFGIYRDLTVSGSHVYTEFSKRKGAVIGQPLSIQPVDKLNTDDARAAVAVQWMIDSCENWTDGLLFLLDSVLWPVAVGEKIFRPFDPLLDAVPLDAMGKPISIRYALKSIEPVNPTVLCFKQPYLLRNPLTPALSPSAGARENSGGAIVDPNAWEADLRFYATDDDGRIDWSFDRTLAADPLRHIVHRGHTLVGIRDNWGGPMRAIVYWDLLAALGRDWFSRYMERYGSPFIVGRTDSSNAEAVTFLQEAFALATKIGGLVVDDDTAVDLKEAMTSNGADAYERFLGVCHREISKVIVGQTQSSEVQATGMGSSVGKLHGEVREDLRIFDITKLRETLCRQLFAQFLSINGIPGRTPKPSWGGLSAEDARETGDLLVSLSNAGLQPTDEAIPVISERVGFRVERKELPVALGGFSEFQPRISDAEPMDVKPLSAAIPRVTHPSDGIAAAKAIALGAAFRGRYAPLRAIILESHSAEEALAKIDRYIPDLKPGQAGALLEEGLQICAAAGARDAKPKAEPAAL